MCRSIYIQAIQGDDKQRNERIYFFSYDHIVAFQSIDVNDFDRGEFIGSDILGKNNSRRQRTGDVHTDGL